MKFLDRTEECARLRRLLDGAEGALACLYGRRRCGKTRLLQECTRGRPSVIYFLADRSERSSQLARFVKEASAVCPPLAAAATTAWGAVLDLWVAVSPQGAILVLDEFPYLVEKDPSLPSVLQRIADALPPTGRKIVISGSSQRMMQGLVLNEGEPLYGRCRVILKLAPIGYPWLRRAFPKSTASDRLAHYAVWGGVPRYWEVCQGECDLWETLRDEVFSPNGLFHEEPSFVLKDDLEGAAQAASVLSLIGQGSERPSEMAGRLQVPQTALARPLKRLMDLGLVRRDIPFGNDVKGNKKSLYKLSDPFLRFWYAFVLPHYSNPRFLTSSTDRAALEKPFRAFMGEAWEELVRATLLERPLPKSSVRWGKVSRWWGTGLNGEAMEVDVVAESADGRMLLVGEAKLKLTDVEARHAFAELEAKAKQLPFSARYKTVLCRLFVAESARPGEVSLGWAEDMKGVE